MKLLGRAFLDPHLCHEVYGSRLCGFLVRLFIRDGQPTDATWRQDYPRLVDAIDRATLNRTLIFEEV